MALDNDRGSNLRGTYLFEACLEFGAGGTFTNYTATGCKVARVSSGNYTITLPQTYPRLLGANLTNGGAASAIADTTIDTNGVVNVTVTEPTGAKKIFVQLVVASNPFNPRISVP